MLIIVDYQAGNLASIRNMLHRLGHESAISDRPADVLRAEKLILPGVGHFDHGMKMLRASGLAEALNQRVQGEGAPVLGICLGAQLLTRGSAEGEDAGLGWIEAETIAFDRSRLSSALRVPHMGWAEVKQRRESGLLIDLPQPSRFYFVHSYHLACDSPDDVLLTAQHGYEFAAGIVRQNIAGVQFHPEKSHKFGMRLLDNFVRHFRGDEQT